MRLLILPGSFAICKLPPDSPIPSWTTPGEFFSITRTPDEISIVCTEDHVPAGIVNCSKGWRCLRVAGAMPFTAVGVLAFLTAPLAAAQISVFAVSTFDTDYLLTQASDFERATTVLRDSGHIVV
jgi:nitrilase